MKVRENKNGKLELYDFSPADSYKIAIQLESDGIAYYTKMLTNLKNPDAKALVSVLLEEEQNHKKFFQDCLVTLKQEVDDDFEQDSIVECMDSKIYSRFFPKLGDMPLDELVEMGVDAERNSVIFYEALSNSSTDPKTKVALQEIIKQEKNHINRFKTLKLLAESDFMGGY
ncbi:ferritin family protein [bacterium]|nr:ferritin family protein [bacterium]